MTPAFADTAYFVALHNRRDALHTLAVECGQLADAIVTTEFILVEVATFFLRPADRVTFAKLDAALRANPNVTVLPSSADLYARGLELFAARPDKEWSLTDCISFEVMAELELTDAVTADQHFEQAGLRVLLKPEDATS